MQRSAYKFIFSISTSEESLQDMNGTIADGETNSKLKESERTISQRNETLRSDLSSDTTDESSENGAAYTRTENNDCFSIKYVLITDMSNIVFNNCSLQYESLFTRICMAHVILLSVSFSTAVLMMWECW
jgi:hemolysin activation/secretion protein